MITVKELAIPEVKLITPKRHDDDRGYFTELANEREFQKYGLPGIFCQENQSLSLKKYTVRGLHAQKPPYAQGKLVRVVRGQIFDVAIDIRQGSRSFGKSVSVVLSEDDLTMIYIPPGFLHGFSTLTDQTVVNYKVTEFYAAGNEFGVVWNDPDLAIDWPVDLKAVTISSKDNILTKFSDLNPIAW